MKQPIQSLLSTVGMGDECGHGSFLTFLIKQNFLYIIDDVRTAAVAAV